MQEKRTIFSIQFEISVNIFSQKSNRHQYPFVLPFGSDGKNSNVDSSNFFQVVFILRFSTPVASRCIVCRDLTVDISNIIDCAEHYLFWIAGSFVHSAFHHHHYHQHHQTNVQSKWKFECISEWQYPFISLINHSMWLI